MDERTLEQKGVSATALEWLIDELSFFADNHRDGATPKAFRQMKLLAVTAMDALPDHKRD